MKYLTLAACAVVVALLLMLSFNASVVAGQALPPAGRRVDYSKFSHRTHTVQEKLACDSCHKFPTANWQKVREGDAAFPDVAEFPEHETCINCHRQQFFARQRPAPAICSNCHVNATPRNTARFPFPSLGEAFLSTAKARDFASDFYVAFPHDKHADATCEDCHQTYQPQGDSDTEFVTVPPKDIGDGFWLKKGTFKTRPLTHAGCFTCHNQESEVAPLPPKCDSCHKPQTSEKRRADFDAKLLTASGIQDWWTTTAWRQRNSSGAFRHEVHSEVKCAQCHDAAAPNAVGVKSCGGADGCHVTATSDDGGVLNLEIDQRNASASFVCTKCHLGFGKEALPPSHLKAVEAFRKSSAAASGRQDNNILKVASGRQGRTTLRVSYAHAGSTLPRYEMVQGQMKVRDDADYSKFQHASSYHARLPCALCHRRESNSPAPVMPGGKDHLPCAGCHVKQFADSSSPICTNCHNNPPTATLKPFPQLSSFNVRFDHARHTGTACANCHRPSRGGVALTIPAGSNAHVTCFQCHGPNAKAGDRDISSCSVCHERGRHTRASQMARAFRVGFSHEEHNRNEGLSCNNCHRVRTGTQTKDVTAPQPLNHHASGRSFSCLSCHNGKRAFGGDDFSACKRCHTGSAWRF